MRLAQVPMFAFTAGWLLATCCSVPSQLAAVTAAIGAVAAGLRLRSRPCRGTITALGFSLGVVWFSGLQPITRAPSTFRSIVKEDRVEMLVRGRVLDGPRHLSDGATFEIAVVDIDETAVNEERLRLWIGSRSPDPIWPGDVIEVFGRGSLHPPSDFPRVDGARDVMGRRGIVGRVTAREPPTILERERNVARFAAKNRVRLERFVAQHAGPHAPIAVAMLTGSRSGISERAWESFRDTGTAHVLAISGLHFGVLAALAWALSIRVAKRSAWICRAIGARRCASTVVLGAMAIYLLMVGAPVSAIRAWVAVAVAVVAVLLLRRPSVFGAICAAAIALTAGERAYVDDLGFRLSFAATFAIALFLYRRPAWLRRDPFAFEEESRVRRVARDFATFVGVSWAATAATWPVLLDVSGTVSLAAPVANLVVVPWVSLVVFPLLVAGSIAVFAFPPAGVVAFEFAGALLTVTVEWLAVIAAHPACVWIPGVGDPWLVVLQLLVVFSVLARGLRGLDVLVVAALVAVFVGWAELRRATPPGRLRVHFIPVGQGDSTLLEGPDGKRVLIDAGGSPRGRDPGRNIVVPYLWRLGITRLDAVVVTHEDIDHSGGVPAVTELIEVGEVVREPRDLGIPWIELDRFTEVGSANDRSVVARVQMGAARLLFAGDVETLAEQHAVEQHGRNLAALVLKVPHHGSSTSSTPDFLDAVAPRVAVVSAGRHSKFGHPHAEVVAAYGNRAARLYSTVTHGLVLLEVGLDGRVVVSSVRVARDFR